jgi:glycosyltransferase involved in cell wall biosynthesis
MTDDHKVVLVLPAYNAEKTLERTFQEIPKDYVDEIILCDDYSTDNTLTIARSLGISHVLTHDKNVGYGGNQKSLYTKALSLDADIVVMLHPDYQYNPGLIPSMVTLVAAGIYPVVLGSRILGTGALKGGMPLYKYIANRALTFLQNLLIGYKLSEYHTGYRAYSREVLETVQYEMNSDDFVFDNEILSQIIMKGFDIGEISCPTHYFPEASSISFRRSFKYGLGVLGVSLKHFLHKHKIAKFGIYA